MQTAKDPTYGGVPANLEAEQITLGSLFLGREGWLSVADTLKPEHFYRPAHAAIYRALHAIHTEGLPPSVPLVAETLKVMHLIGEVGADFRAALVYLSELSQCSASQHLSASHATVVREKWLARTMIDRFAEYSSSITSGEKPDEVLASAYSWLGELAKGQGAAYHHISESAKTAFQLAEEWYTTKRAVTGIPSGVNSLDHMTTGFQPGEYIVLGARTSQGKTALMLQTAAQAAECGDPVGIFSLEMSGSALAQRLLSHISHVSGRTIRAGMMDPDQWVQYGRAYGKLADWPVYICDKAGLHIRELPILARRMVYEHGVRALMLDYVGLLRTDSVGAGTRQEEVSVCSRICGQVARDLNVPMLVCAQLNRQVEYRTEPEPRLADLRESGSLEQDPHVVILIHNPKLVDDPQGLKRRPAKLLVEKQRNLPTGVVDVLWDGNSQRFLDKEQTGP